MTVTSSVSITVSNSLASTTTSTTVPTTTTTTIGGGGGGGGGGTGGGGGAGGGGGGGSSIPIVSQSGSCVSITNVAVPNSFDFSIDGHSYHVVDNYIGSNYTSIIIGNMTYVINLGSSVNISSDVSMELTNVSYLPIEHSVSFKACPLVQNVTTLTVIANYSNSTGLTITKVTPSDLTNSITISNVGNVPPLPSGYSGIFIGNVSINSTTITSLNFKVNYDCSINASTLQPYMYKNGTWEQISAFSVDSAACTITFTIPKDPVIALAQESKSPAQLKPTVQSTSTVQQTEKPIIVPSAPGKQDYGKLIMLIIGLLVIAVTIGAAYSRGTKAMAKKGRDSRKGR